MSPSERVLSEAIATLQAERDDALAYLGTVRAILESARSLAGVRACARDLAHVLVHELAAESCAIVLCDDGAPRPALIGFATQAERFGPPSDDVRVDTWIAAAERAEARQPILWLRRTPEGDLGDAAFDDLDGESLQILPFAVSDELRGAIVLHRLAMPAQRFVYSTASRLLADAVGEALTIARSRDVTARVTARLEHELGITRHELSTRDHTLLERERAIATLTDDLLRASESKRDFLGAISHELRTPLNAVVGFAELLREETTETLDPTHAEMLDGIVVGARHLTALVDDVLLLIQLEAGGFPVETAVLDLRALLDDAAAEIAPSDPARRLALDVHPRAARPELDGRLLRRVLVHLLGNAHKFSSGAVVARGRPHGDGTALAVEIADVGAGMPPDDARAMFELFARDAASIRRCVSGLGLGLTLVDRAVRALGGRVEVETAPDAGTTFRLLFPAALARRSPSAATAAEVPRARRAHVSRLRSAL
ncbi:MAG TPA: HAMP domain-containing sensor histidine kinase [Candidatus Binatia bacterium]|nr:HAMP domain-containing sensor histidine kinase [Candidatus Binatia bacterium]